MIHRPVLLIALFSFLLPHLLSAQTFVTSNGGIIPDNNTEVCFPIVVSGLPNQINPGFGISGLCMDITHTYVADLRISLKSPDNTVVMIAHNIGGGGDNFTSTCLSMDGIDGWLIFGAAPFTGTFIPEESLNLFNTGMNPNGTWELCIKDEVPADVGNLNFASITFSNNPPPDPGLPPGVCSTTNASGCVCADTTLTDCDLLPDMTASGLIIQNAHTEYPGYLTLSNATPNIGYGPLEISGTNICYCDTVVVGCSTPVCPDGSYPKQLINQKIYHKDGQTMTTWDHPAGTMTYHPTHGHMHVDNWASYTLRIGTSNPDPLSWPMVGDGAKVSFCLVNLGTCNGNPGYCVDTAGNVLLGNDIPNLGLGIVSGCGNQQGIFVGSLDIYSQGLPGQQIDFPGICNGDYFIISHTDPDNVMLETNDNNNYAVVPITLTQQGTGPANPSFNYSVNGLTVSFVSNVPGVTEYFWDFGDGDTSNVSSVSHTFPGPGVYTVTLELFNGICNSFVAQSITVSSPTGYDDKEIVLSDVNISPNPFREHTRVSYRLLKDTEFKIVLYNLLSQSEEVLFQGNGIAGDHEIDIKPQNKGVHLLRLITTEGASVFRLIAL